MRTHGYLVRLLGGIAVIGVVAAGCSDDKATTDTANADTATTDTTGAPVTDAPTTIAGPPVNPDPVVVELHTGSIVMSQTVFAAGTINFEATNMEADPHVFALARGDSYEDLPLLSNGAVDLVALGDDFIVKTGLLMPGLGTTRVLTVDLAPGTYVIYCNGGDDPSKGETSHASLGEVLTITVV